MNHEPIDPSLKKNRDYYLEFGEFFYRVFDNTQFLNLGFQDSNQTFTHPIQAQKQLVLEVAKSGDFKPNQAILDVGCGFGGAAAFIATSFQSHVTGIDVFKYHIEQASERQSSNNVKILFGNSMDMPFEDDTFDRLYSVESAFHYENKNQFIHEACRVLKSGGKLVLADILKDHHAKNKWLTRVIQGGIGSPNLFDVDLYRLSASEAGLEIKQVRDISKQVRNTLPVWIKFCIKKAGKLYQHYGIKSFAMIIGFLLEFYLICSHPSFSYQIIVFEKP